MTSLSRPIVLLNVCYNTSFLERKYFLFADCATALLAFSTPLALFQTVKSNFGGSFFAAFRS